MNRTAKTPILSFVMALGHGRNQDRVKSAIGVAAVHAMLGYVLVAGLGYRVAGGMTETLRVFDVPVELPPPPIEDKPPAGARTPDPEGAATPPNLESRATPIVAPPPAIVLPVPPPLPAAPVAGTGSDTSQGASDIAGPGTGAGGTGTGTGSGGSGTGTGGGGSGIALRAHQIAGRIRDADYPDAAERARAEGIVFVHFTVDTNGRASRCRVIESSGNADLDTTTCRLIERRYRFRPARDARGKLMAEVKGWEQRWWLEGRGR